MWIDTSLEKYRKAVAHDLYAGSHSSNELVSWLFVTNPELHSMVFMCSQAVHPN